MKKLCHIEDSDLLVSIKKIFKFATQGFVFAITLAMISLANQPAHADGTVAKITGYVYSMASQCNPYKPQGGVGSTPAEAYGQACVNTTVGTNEEGCPGKLTWSNSPLGPQISDWTGVPGEYTYIAQFAASYTITRAYPNDPFWGNCSKWNTVNTTPRPVSIYR